MKFSGYQLVVQWNYLIYFHVGGSSLTTFCNSFRKRVHNSKEIVNLQSLLVLSFGYVDIKTYKYYYIIERVLFIYRFFISFISTFSFLLFLYTVSFFTKSGHFFSIFKIGQGRPPPTSPPLVARLYSVPLVLSLDSE